MADKLFRFEKLEIWQKAANFSMDFFDLAEGLEQRKYLPICRTTSCRHAQYYE